LDEHDRTDLSFQLLRRLRQEDLEFKASLDYIARPYVKNIKKERKKPGTDDSHL
jgi:hypothetical protein